ncbi:sigma-70 family RNA polymerase sigma factor [Cyanobium sp. ATX 6A2]|uniref:sigma-70 family RNA polymerase sigma factor n=1 Tax=Cyanobium sp. ATX 6A2 TaxID=2823700 RepID=UPI0020CC3686|nr:sigma-70 family RNA polymerase sigma factor [Cyanobium sp. ATX 6A2]MCP9886940.1 sigma-70 family RNA polymerase sigma factor [Cyanobium sp. ATX 6A2]
MGVADHDLPPPPGDLAGLYDAYSPAVYRLALRLCRNPSAAEDLVQDVFLRYWRQERYDPSRGPVLAYLLLLTRSMAINRLNQQRNRWQVLQRWSTQLLGGHQRSPHDWAELGDLAERMRAALAQIHANQRQVLELAYYEGMSQTGIAEHLQIPLGTVKTRSRQGLLALRRQLQDFAADSSAPLLTPPSLADRHEPR